MNMDVLSYVKFGDKDGLGEFLFENGMQHQWFVYLVLKMIDRSLW